MLHGVCGKHQWVNHNLSPLNSRARPCHFQWRIFDVPGYRALSDYLSRNSHHELGPVRLHKQCIARWKWYIWEQVQAWADGTNKLHERVSQMPVAQLYQWPSLSSCLWFHGGLSLITWRVTEKTQSWFMNGSAQCVDESQRWPWKTEGPGNHCLSYPLHKCIFPYLTGTFFLLTMLPPHYIL